MTAVEDFRDTFAAAGPDVIASERAVVGTAVGSREGAEAMSDVVADPGWFVRPAHALIFAAALRVADRGDPVDPVLVLHELVAKGEISRAGGGDYLHGCYAEANPSSARWHAARVREAARQRALVEKLQSALQCASSPSFDPETGYDTVRSLVEQGVAGTGAETPRTFREILTETMDALESSAPVGLSLPWLDLDAVLLGLTPGQLVLVAARPSIGKTLVLVGMAAHVAVKLGKPVLLSSAEMSADEVAMRMLSSYARVGLHTIRSRQMDDQDWRRIGAAYDKIADAPLVIDDTAAPTVTHIRSRLRAMERAGAPAALFAGDYLQLFEAPRAESRQVAVGALGKALKQTAREFGIPALVACQLNRGPEMRSDKRPLLADLRESGELEQAADVVIGLHREDAYERETPRAGEIDMIVLKNRQGPLATVTAAFQGHYARVADMAPGTGQDYNWTPSSALGGQR